jgi:hypothetical protein
MASNARVCRNERDKENHLRDVVLQLGERLGWEPRDVMAFAEGLTGCPWVRCASVEFAAVLDEYQMLIQAIEAKGAQRAAREREHGSAGVEGGSDASPG